MLRPEIFASGLADRRRPGLRLFVLLGLIVGFLGQGSWGVGVATPTAVSVVVTEVIGGAGNRKPVRVSVSLAVMNRGTDPVRVIGPDSGGTGTRVLRFSPTDLLVEPGAIGRIDADATLACDRPAPLHLPDLRLEQRDGDRRGFPIGGSGLLLEACARAVPDVRPLAAQIVPAAPGSPAPTADTGLTVRFSSPTGRQLRLLSVRAGTVALRTSPAAVTVSGRNPTEVRLAPVRPCPQAWHRIGIPTALSVDIVDREDNDRRDFQAAVQIPLGPPLTSWVLAHSCPAGR